ncbi:MAG: carbonic anhydrase [Alphaproteobacteria bacterium]
MLSRRLFCGCLAAATTTFTSEAVRAQGASCAIFTPDRQKAVTPNEALTRLVDGNRRFVAGSTINCDLREQVKGTAHGQAPFATVLGCIDSRVPPELVFDQKVGDIFAARIAGNFADTDVPGSLEFATKVAGSKLIVVLGHTQCGAIKGAIDNVKLGNLTAMLTHFKPAVDAVTNIPGPRTSANHDLVDAVCERHARLTAELLLARSPVLKELVDGGQLRVVAALHNLDTGAVKLLT